MGWKIVDIDQPCILKTYLNNLIILTTKRLSIPMSDIDVLMVSDTKINLTVNAINELINNGVCIILCNGKHLLNSYILGYNVQKQGAGNFKKQLTWSETFKSNCWNWILRIKINNQLDLLDFYRSNDSDWKEIINNADDLADVMQMYEAKIASYFFRQLFGKSFNRNKEYLTNSCLDYGYIVLTNMVARSITKKGLHPQIAFYHGSIYSAFPLAYDIVEIFRIAIDLFVKNLFENNLIKNKDLTLTRDIKNCLLDYISNYKICIDGKFEYINNAIDKVIDWIINQDFLDHQISYDFAIEGTNYELQLKEQI